MYAYSNVFKCFTPSINKKIIFAIFKHVQVQAIKCIHLISLYYFKKKHIETITKKRDVTHSRNHFV